MLRQASKDGTIETEKVTITPKFKANGADITSNNFSLLFPFATQHSFNLK